MNKKLSIKDKTTKQNSEEIDNQLSNLRSEWDRNSDIEISESDKSVVSTWAGNEINKMIDGELFKPIFWTQEENSKEIDRDISFDKAIVESDKIVVSVWTGATSRNLDNLEYQKMMQERRSQKEFFDMVYGNFENSEYADNLKLIKTNGAISYFKKKK